MGIFSGFIKDKEVELIGVEGGGDGVETERTGATLCKGNEGILHGSLSFVLRMITANMKSPFCIGRSQTILESGQNMHISK